METLPMHPPFSLFNAVQCDDLPDPVYAFADLIAEIGSNFLCEHLGVTGHMQDESYVVGWLSKLKSDKKALFIVYRKLRASSEYFLTPLDDQAETPSLIYRMKAVIQPGISR